MRALRIGQRPVKIWLCMIEADCSGNGAGSVLARSCPLARDDGTGTALHRPSPFSAPSLILHSFPAHPRACPRQGRLCARSFALRPGAATGHPRANYPIHCGCFGSFHRFSAAFIHRIVPAPGRGPRPTQGWPQNAVQGRLPGPLPEAESSCARDNAASQQTGSKPFASGWIAPRCTAASARSRLQGEQIAAAPRAMGPGPLPVFTMPAHGCHSTAVFPCRPLSSTVKCGSKRRKTTVLRVPCDLQRANLALGPTQNFGETLP
jgi:hypothetical protein